MKFEQNLTSSGPKPLPAEHRQKDPSSLLFRGLCELGPPLKCPRSATLCWEGDSARGIFLLTRGIAKLTTLSEEGRSMVLRVLRPKEIYGLSTVMLDRTYEASMEMVVPGVVRFIPTNAFKHLLDSNQQLAFGVAMILARECQEVSMEMHSLGQARSADERLAHFLLSPSHPVVQNENGWLQIEVPFTHSEIGEMIGCTRETVSRSLSKFIHNGWVRRSGEIFEMKDRHSIASLCVSSKAA